MADVATVTSLGTAKQGAVTKGGGASAGAGTVLDGAFAALLGAAGRTPAKGEAPTDAKVVQPAIDPALIGGDTSIVATAGEGVASETGEAQPKVGDIDPVPGKARKAAARGKDVVEGGDVLLQAQAAQAAALPTPAPNAPGEPSSPLAKAAADGVASIAADAMKSNSAAAPAATTDMPGAVQALVTKGEKPDKAGPGAGAGIVPFVESVSTAKDSKGDKGAKDGVRATPSVESVPTGKEAAPIQVAAASNASGQQSDQPADGHGDGTRDNAADKTLAVKDASASAGAADALHDIVQSLPPVVQSQLSPVGAVGAGRPASIGEVLSDNAIDMSASGQWIDRMAREIATVADGSGHARFQLNPPNLGRIQVDLWRGDDQMNLRLVAETDEAAQRLREGQPALEAHARVASLSLGSVTVEKSSAPLDSGDKQNQRQGTEQNGTANQQSFAQAQGQSAQGRNNNSGGNLNRGGASAVIGSERQAEPEQDARTSRAGDPRVRFA